MESTTAEKLKPPYGRQSSWYETFFDLNQRQKLDKIDLDFIRLNIVSHKDEYKLFNGLRFLGLIKEDGIATGRLASLRVVGDDFKKNLNGIVKEAYQNLFSAIVVEKAKPENLINYFVQKHEMGFSIAEQATKLFVYFAKKTDISISPELLSMEMEKRPRTGKGLPKKTKSTTEIGKTAAPPEGMEELKYGDIRIWLPKGDVDSVKKAIRLLEFHIKELESNENKPM